jgi:transposase
LAGLTVREFARRYRVSEDKVRAWVARGELKAINTAAALCGKPRWVILPEALAEFEKARRGGPAPKPQRQRRRRAQEIDFYPD